MAGWLQVKWQLMVASCYRRVQRLTEAFATYKQIDKKHPDNVECLNYLVKLSKVPTTPNLKPLTLSPRLQPRHQKPWTIHSTPQKPKPKPQTPATEP